MDRRRVPPNHAVPAFRFPTGAQFSAPLRLCVKIILEKGRYQGKARGEILWNCPQHAGESSKHIGKLSKLIGKKTELIGRLSELI